jgi:hypothetical protein
VMGGCNEGDAGVGGHAPAGGDVDALVIDGNGNGAAAGAEQKGADEGVAGLFEPGGVAGVEQDAGGDVESLLGTGDDHDLGGIAADGAGGAEVGADSFAKGLEAEGVEVVGGVDAQGSAMAGEEFGPEVEGKVVERGLMNAEGSPAMTPGIGVVGGELHGAAGGAAGAGRFFCGAADGGGRMREGGGDKGAGADAAFEVALGEELRIGIEDGKAGDGEFGGEGAAGGNLLAGGEIAAKDGVAEACVDLAMEGGGGLTIDRDDGDDACGNVEHWGMVVVMNNVWQVVMSGYHFGSKSGHGVRAG